MSESLGYGLFFLLVIAWLYWDRRDILGKDTDAERAPAMPSMVEETTGAETRDDASGDVAVAVTADEWHGTTRISLARVNGKPIGNGRQA